MRTKPLVGVTPLYDNDRESVWMIPGYLEALSACGALPVILPFSPSDAALMVEECDGILFTGGNDVSPSLYEEEPDPACGELCPRRDELEYALLSEALNKDVPLLGIFNSSMRRWVARCTRTFLRRCLQRFRTAWIARTIGIGIRFH